MLTNEQTVNFLTNILGFKNWKQSLENDKLSFLRELVPYYAHHVPFQNITMASIPPEKRYVVTVPEIIAAGLNGTGGPCINQNYFITLVLQALGFNSYVVSGYVHGPGNLPDNHVMCAVEFSPEEIYVIDVGVALPFAGPIPMHDLPHTQVGAGFRYRYTKADDREGVYYRVQLDGALFGGDFEDKTTEYTRYEFTMTPRTIDYFMEPLVIVFTNTDKSIFLQHPFMFRYFEEDDDGNISNVPNVNGDRKWILIRGVSVLIATDKTRNVTHYSSYDEVKPLIYKYFPQLPKENVEKAVEYFNNTVTAKGYFKAK